MKANWLGVGAVALAAVAVFAYKVTRPTTTAHSVSSSPVVIMIADLSEADSKCGCGEIIRSVRAAAAKGVAVREMAPGSEATTEKQYKITVMPTVLFLDHEGAVQSRFEGEDEQALAGIRDALNRLVK